MRSGVRDWQKFSQKRGVWDLSPNGYATQSEIMPRAGYWHKYLGSNIIRKNYEV